METGSLTPLNMAEQYRLSEEKRDLLVSAATVHLYRAAYECDRGKIMFCLAQPGMSSNVVVRKDGGTLLHVLAQVQTRTFYHSVCLPSSLFYLFIKLITISSCV